MIKVNALSSRKLSLVKLVAVLVTICFGLQIYNDFNDVNYKSISRPYLADLWLSKPSEPAKPA